MTRDQKTSFDSLAEASRSRVDFSGHGGALGAAGHREVSFDPENCAYLREPGQSVAITPGPSGFDSIMIGAMWDNAPAKKSGLISRLVKKAVQAGVDIDLGCLYELSDGTRGCIQAFGKKFGSYEEAPYIGLSGDERTGDAKGHDEYMLVKGKNWEKIKRILVYLYIYRGAPCWKQINPRIIIDVPGEDDLVVTLGAHDDALALCAVGGLENVRGGIKLTNYTEYFPGHAEMDRAFGFGLQWAEGKKEGE